MAFTLFFSICPTLLLFTDVAMASSDEAPSTTECVIPGRCTLPDGFVYIEDYFHQNVATHRTEAKQVTKIRECLRYATVENFSGSVVRGYHNGSRAVTTVATAEALYKAQAQANAKGYTLIVYDSYRPKKAVDYFVEWGNSPDNCSKCRANYFPDIDNKTNLFYERDPLHPRYIAPLSRHSAGNTVDLSLIRLATPVHFPPVPVARKLNNNQTVNYLSDGSLDMYTSFDLLSPASWSKDGANLIPKNGPYMAHRALLRNIMIHAGFEPLTTEWWHFSLKVANETRMDFEF